MRTLTAFWALPLSVALTACGGGSGGLSPSTPTLVATPIAAPVSAVRSASFPATTRANFYAENSGSTKPDTSPLKGEVFTANDVTVSNKRLDNGFRAKFAAHGEAKGPYPGSFVASGGWQLTVGWTGSHWAFDESFTITSGARKISGTIAGLGGCCTHDPPMTGKTFGPATREDGLRYTYRSWSGPVTTNKIMAGFLSESLRGR